MGQSQRFDLYQEVTDRIIAAIGAGTPPWRRPWTGSTPGLGFPTRATGERYRGINVLMLWLTAAEKGYTAAHWFTYRQAQAAGGQVRKGGRSSLVVKYGTVEKDRDDGETDRFAYARAYRVFNADQIEGLAAEFYRPAEPPRDLGTTSDPALDGWFRETGLTIETSGMPRAYYAPADDRVHMPPVATFESAARYFATLAHECVHATGHAKRLDRLAKFNRREDYAQEELVAEIGGAMLCVSLGIGADYDQNGAYVESWLAALRDDKREIFRTASAAGRAADFLHEVTARGRAAA
ncbi:MAG: zincin-like metallopeptidase domain-containing protein [Pseudomonadota bacterium]